MSKVDYNNISRDFAKSRNNMKWEEIEYFLEKYSSFLAGKKVLDIGCGSGRLLEHFQTYGIDISYTGIDASSGMIDEANKRFSEEKFLVGDMNDLDKILIGEKYDFIFFIASFHHLDNLEDRKKVLDSVKKLLNKDGIVFMTNWALNSELNNEKYGKDVIKNSKNEFSGYDYNIKFGDYLRFYHCFSLEELNFLFSNSGFEITENRLFDTGKNFISISKN